MPIGNIIVTNDTNVKYIDNAWIGQLKISRFSGISGMKPIV